jgi:hypothetical protein
MNDKPIPPQAEWPIVQLRRTLTELVFWLDVPDAQSTSRPQWLASITSDIGRHFNVVASVNDSSRFIDHDELMSRRRDAMEFANILHANPGITLAQWGDHFPDCLRRLRSFVRDIEAFDYTDPDTVDCDEVAATTEPVAQDPDDADRQRGLELWNSKKNWSKVNESLGRSPGQKKATTQEIKRYAERTGQYIRTGKPGVNSSD